MNMLSLLIIALLGEAIWETAKMIWQNGKLSIDRIGALAVGLLLAIGTGLDLFALAGVPIYIPYLGIILTGILISRGASFIHDLMASISNLQQNTKVNFFKAVGVDKAQESSVEYKNNEAEQQNQVKQEQFNQTAENSNPGINTQTPSAQ